MNAYYWIIADDKKGFPRWYLRAPVDEAGRAIDARRFVAGKEFSGDSPLFMALRIFGPRMDFNFADFDAVVTRRELNEELLSRFKINAQRIPVKIEKTGEGYEILNVLDCLHCIDEAASEFTRFGENDGRPDKVGKYLMFIRLRINGDMVMGHDLFRVDEWPLALIASQQFKEFLEERKVTGIAFKPVTGPT